MPSVNTSKAELSFNNYLLIVILVSVLAVGATGFAANSMIQSFLRNQKVITGKTAAEKQLVANIDAFGQLKTEYNELGATADYLNAGLPAKADYPGLVSTLANIAGVSGVKLKSVTPAELSATADTAQPQAGTESYSFGANLSGNYAAMQVFLKNLELSARQFKIVNFDLVGPTSAQALSIQLVAYHQKPATMESKLQVVK